MNKILSYAWAGMYVLCTALGTIPYASGVVKVALMVIAVLFFLPPALMLYNGITAGNKTVIKRIRIISLISLLATFLLLVAYFVISLLYVGGSLPPVAVNITFFLLLVVSSPLFCGQVFYLSLFLWACLLFASIVKFPPRQKKQDQR